MKYPAPVAAKRTTPRGRGGAAARGPARAPAGRARGRSTTRSWSAPSGQTPPQKTRPKSSAESSGRKKNARTVSGTGARGVGERGDDVLDRPHGADAPLAPEAEVERREDRQQEEPAPGAAAQREPGREAEGGGEHRDVQVLEGGQRAGSGIGRRRQPVPGLELRLREAEPPRAGGARGRAHGSRLRLEQVGAVGGHAPPRVGGAVARDRALVAVEAAVVPHLELERAVAEGRAALDALAAADAERLVDQVLVVGVLHERAPDRPGRGRAGSRRTRSSRVHAGLEVAEAELAVAADGVAVHALDRRGREHAAGGALAALDALFGSSCQTSGRRGHRDAGSERPPRRTRAARAGGAGRAAAHAAGRARGSSSAAPSRPPAPSSQRPDACAAPRAGPRRYASRAPPLAPAARRRAARRPQRVEHEDAAAARRRRGPDRPRAGANDAGPATISRKRPSRPRTRDARHPLVARRRRSRRGGSRGARGCSSR